MFYFLANKWPRVANIVFYVTKRAKQIFITLTLLHHLFFNSCFVLSAANSRWWLMFHRQCLHHQTKMDVVCEPVACPYWPCFCFLFHFRLSCHSMPINFQANTKQLSQVNTFHCIALWCLYPNIFQTCSHHNEMKFSESIVMLHLLLPLSFLFNTFVFLNLS